MPGDETGIFEETSQFSLVTTDCWVRLSHSVLSNILQEPQYGNISKGKNSTKVPE